MSHDAMSVAARKDATTAAPGEAITYVLNGERINRLNFFLLEENPGRAVGFWFNSISPSKHKPRTASEIRAALVREIALIDELITEQLNGILHHPRFQRLEASWRGLQYLVEQSSDRRGVKVRMLDISWQEVTRDITRAIEFDQSLLFQKIYSEEYGTPGGEPYGVIIADYAVTHRPMPDHPFDDMTTLRGLAQVAAASFAPFVAGAHPAMFGLDDFSGLGMPVDLEKVFSSEEYVKWRSLRETPDARFIGLTLPRMLIRKPYRQHIGVHREILFQEDVAGATADKYLWANACYAFGAILAREFGNVGWFGHIRGVPRGHLGGGLVDTIPVESFATDRLGTVPKMVTEVAVTDATERRLSDLGFIPLCQCHDTPYAAFFSNQSVQRPQGLKSIEATINAKLSSMLQHILCGSRVAHYLKVIIRDKVGSFLSAAECERYLQNWLHRYTTGREDLDWEEQARFPLRESRVQVADIPGKPGQYRCVIHLRPHYQLDNMVSELQLVTELTQV